jgi:hypothetical protein
VRRRLLSSAFRLLLSAICLLPTALFAQNKTTVTGTLLGPDGSPANGFISVTATVPFVSADGYNVTAGPPIHMTITNGTFSAALIPNAGSSTSTCSPPNTCDYYQVTFNLSSTLGNAFYSETWEVPSTGPVAYQTIIVTSPPSVNYQFPFAQLTPPTGCLTDQFPEWTGSAWTCSSGSSGGSMTWPSAAGVAVYSGSSSWAAPLSTSGSGSTLCLTVSCAMTTPNLGTPSAVTLTNASGLPLSTGVTGNLPVANLNGGSGASSSTFWRGDGTWATPSGGGGGTPGGSNGQIQYDNAGAFGGFTLAGDCALSMPNITCTRTNGTAFGSLATSSAALAQTLAAVSHKWLNSYNAATGAFTQSQPASSDLSDYGSVAGGLFGSQTGNYIFAAPNGSNGNGLFRLQVAADQPNTTVNAVTNDTNVTGSISAQNLTLGWTGQLSIARGGTGNSTGNAATATALASTPTQCSGNNFATGVAASGNANCSQSGFSNLSGSLALSQTVLTTLGDILAVNSTPAFARVAGNTTTSNYFLRSAGNGTISALPSFAQVAFGDLNGSLASGQLPSGWNPVSIANGGTGQVTPNAAFNVLSPMTTEGDLTYYHSSAGTRLAVGASGTYLRSNGTDPQFSAIQAVDVPTLNQSTTGNATTATDASGLTFGSTNIPNGSTAPGSDQQLTYNGSNIVGTPIRRVFTFGFGSDDAPPLTTAQITPQRALATADVTMVVDVILVKASSGASTVQFGYRHSTGGSPTTTAYTSAVMTPATVTNVTDTAVCANAAGTAIMVDGVSVTCGTLATQAWTAGDSIETIGGAADGTSTRLSVQIQAHIQ